MEYDLIMSAFAITALSFQPQLYSYIEIRIFRYGYLTIRFNVVEVCSEFKL